ncbi:hypothetical protein COV19_00420 [Candidatus Woesearchaeota archaeon CG10_big_fil_rev_8_21_14_0_10_44_13]|nr:MAG: hypothetical protein COV19_00420 [Candidatus Woesearchaeota archaeon CG10_big_fil_rev_8_21_14_0_10_44_13]
MVNVKQYSPLVVAVIWVVLKKRMNQEKIVRGFVLRKKRDQSLIAAVLMGNVKKSSHVSRTQTVNFLSLNAVCHAGWIFQVMM